MDFRPVPGKKMWQLKMLGKGNKWRTVFVPLRVIDAIKAHWAARGHTFEDPNSTLSLVAPVVLSNAPETKAKHLIYTEGEQHLAGE